MSDEDAQVEAILSRYRPAGPPARLRDRVLNTSGRARSSWATAGWLSMAAMLVLCLGLHLATERVAQQTRATLSPGPVGWTAEAEEAADLLNGQGRRYIAIALAADEPRMTRLSRRNAPAGLFKDIQ